MFDKTITLFNYHQGLWYPVKINGVDILANNATNPSAQGNKDANTVNIIINCDNSQKIGGMQYVGPKRYSKLTAVSGYLTFSPERDFIYVGEYASTGAISEDDYDNGFYTEFNNQNDDVYMITDSAYYSLIPHFEIGGR